MYIRLYNSFGTPLMCSVWYSMRRDISPIEDPDSCRGTDLELCMATCIATDTGGTFFGAHETNKKTPVSVFPFVFASLQANKRASIPHTPSKPSREQCSGW